MNRQLSLEFVRIVEQAAIKSGRLMGRGDKEGADQLAVDGMHEQFAKTPVSGTVALLLFWRLLRMDASCMLRICIWTKSVLVQELREESALMHP